MIQPVLYLNSGFQVFCKSEPNFAKTQIEVLTSVNNVPEKLLVSVRVMVELSIYGSGLSIYGIELYVYGSDLFIYGTGLFIYGTGLFIFGTGLYLF